MNDDEYVGQEIEIKRADWQVNRDLFVSYQAASENWVVSLLHSRSALRFNQGQYHMLCTFDRDEQDEGMPLSAKEQRFAQKLARYHLIERRKEALIRHEPACWNDPLQLVRWALRMYAINQRRPYITASLTNLLQENAGCYVCLKRQEQLRGCFGSLEPNLPHLADDIMQNTLAAAYLDRRFIPVSADEINALEFSVDIVQERQVVVWPGDWDPRRYGLQLRREREVLATLLPGLEGIDNAAQQYQTALRKAGVASEEAITLEVFTTLRFPSSASIPLRPYETALAIPQWKL